MEPLELARQIAAIAEDELAQQVTILDLGQVSTLCDHFVIAHAPSRVQIRAVAQAIEGRLSDQGLQPRSVQGRREGSWVVLDYGIVVVHLFLDREREFYDLEGLWSQAPVLYRSEASASQAPPARSLTP